MREVARTASQFVLEVISIVSEVADSLVFSNGNCCFLDRLLREPLLLLRRLVVSMLEAGFSSASSLVSTSTISVSK